MRVGASAKRVEDVLDEVLAVAQLLTAADFTAIVLEEQGRLAYRGMRGGRELPKEPFIPVKGSVIAAALESQTTTVGERLSEDPLLSNFALIKREAARTLMVSPMRIGNSGRGCLLVGWRSDVSPSTDHIHTAETLTNYLATLIDSAQSHLREQERAAELDAVIDQIPSGVLVIDRQRQVRVRNAAGRQIVGQSAVGLELVSTLPGYERRDPITQAELPADQLPIIRALEGEVVEGFEYVLCRPDRLGDVSIIASASPIRGANGEVTAAVMVYSDVTRERALARDLASREAHLRSIYDTMACGVLVRDGNGHITYANRAAAAIVGVRVDQMEDVLKTWKRIDGSSRSIESDVWNGPRALQTGEAERNQLIGFTAPDGGDRWHRYDAVPFFDESGAVLEVVVSFYDVTDQKRAEDELRQALAAVTESENRYRDLVENSWDWITTHDLQGYILSANKAAQQALGYDQQTLIGTRLSTYVLPSTVDDLSASLGTVVREGAASGVARIVNSSGEIRVMEYNSSLRTDGVDTPIVRVMARDVTERDRAQEALKGRVEQQAAVAKLGQLAIRQPLLSVLEQATILGRATLNVNCTSIGELTADKHAMKVVASSGWASQNDWPIPLNPHSPSTRCMTINAAVIVEDYEQQTEFMPPPQDRHPGIRSCICVPIRLDDGVFGVIGAFATTPRAFTQEDVHFLETIANVVGSSVDKSRSRDALAENELRYRRIVETAQEGIWTTNAEGQTTFANQKMAQMLGCNMSTLLRSSVFDFADHRDYALISASLDRRARGVAEQHDVRLVRRDGGELWVSLSTNPLFGEGGEFIGALAMVADISDRKQAEQALAHQALHDILTGLPNRALFQDRVEQAILAARRDGTSAAVMFIDMDGFKDVNDSFGHQQGDQILRQVGERLRSVVRESDTIARLGGDEFAVVMQGIRNTEEVAFVTTKMLKSMEVPFLIGDQLVEVTASIGIASCPEDGEDVTTLLQRADTAMYVAKQQRNSFALYAAGVDHEPTNRLVVTAELRHAIERENLVLYYQPKVSMSSGRIVGVEALVRWPHPDRGLIPPDHFIPVAEKTGLIRPLSQWVVNAALRQLRGWHELGLQISTAVNLSMRDLRDPQLADNISRLLDTWGVNPAWLSVEITETMIMADPRQTMAAVTRLSEMGIRFCIDDFGTGYSSLAYLKELPAQEIKIDKSFVMDLLTDGNDATIVRSVIDLAHNLGRTTVAEGVESKDVWETLSALGCDVAQGYYMGHPMPIAVFETWLAESDYGLVP